MTFFSLSQQTVNLLAILLPQLIQLAGLAFAVLIDSYIESRHRRIMLIIVALAFGLVVQNYADALLTTRVSMPAVRTIFGIIGYSVRPVILALFFYIASPEGRHWPAWILVGVNALVYLSALFSDISFVIDANNAFRRGPLNFCCFYVSFALIIQLLFVTIRKYRDVGLREILLPVFIVLLIVGSFLLDITVGLVDQPVAFLTMGVISGSMLYYIWLHLQFVRQHERALQAEQRIQIMMSQIQPHFLYNTLSTIQALCREDPARAEQVVKRFGSYLRQNIDSLSQSGLIPFDKELEHTQVYASIEQERFSNIRVEYDICDEGFFVPALTVQPLVENAIRHGVRIREDGRVTVAARRREGAHEIVIRDNGKGFNPAEAQGDGRHIGIQNVRERVEKLCGGTLTIDSRPGEGTTVTVRIPVASSGDEP